MKYLRKRLHVGPRTWKTAVAVILSMLIVDYFGTSSSKLIFAMLGAMAAVMPTFRESVESCLSQIIGVIFGAIMGAVLRPLPVPQLVTVGIGIVAVITLYNFLNIHFSPSLSCFMVVLICTTPDIVPMEYAWERIWDTTIGLGVGMLINTLVYPYDNSRQIRKTVESLNKEVITFLEDMFDGDDMLPDTEAMDALISSLERQLSIFSKQKLIKRMRKQQMELEMFRSCESKAKLLVAHMQVLCHQRQSGCLSEENRQRLNCCGADICTENGPEFLQEKEVVTNYHVGQILKLRQELLAALETVKK